MHGDCDDFFSGLAATPLVREGRDAYLGKAHTVQAVYSEMLLQVCRLYAGLPDPRSLSMREIAFFYDGCRGELYELTKPKGE